jgi:hypothetical protein
MAAVAALLWAGWMNRPGRPLVWDLEQGVGACGLDPESSEGADRSLGAVHLTLRRNGRVVFSEAVTDVDCRHTPARDAATGLVHPDIIQIGLPTATFDATRARWYRIYRGLGATPAEQQQLARWEQDVRAAVQARHRTDDRWMQGGFSVPGMDVYTQSLPMESTPPHTYGSHLSLRFGRAVERAP